MRIGIDARTILNPEKGDAIGVGHYTYQLIRHLLEIDHKNEYVLFFDFRVREKDVRKFRKKGVKIKFYPFSDYSKYMPGIYNELLTLATLKKEKLDILHSTSPQSRIPSSYAGKLVVTFHDLAPYKIPECFPRWKKIKEKTNDRLMAKKADKIIAVSQSIKNDLESIWNLGNKAKIIYSGLDERFFEKPDLDYKKIVARLGITKKYILFLGTLEPSKNITRLLQAFAQFKKKWLQKRKIKNSHKFDFQLVLAGKRGWLGKEYRHIARDLGIHKDVVFPGYIIGDELVPLFKEAELFIMPSLYEGFGMTVLEALATETPSIISDVSSLPEIAHNVAYFINPLDVSQMTELMLNMIEDENFRNKYLKKGKERALYFNWKKTAKETLELYKKL